MGAGNLRQCALGGGTGFDRLESDAEAGVEGPGLRHEIRLERVVVDVGDDHFVAARRQDPRQVVIRRADAAVADRAENVRRCDADAFRVRGSFVALGAEIRFQGRDHHR